MRAGFRCLMVVILTGALLGRCPNLVWAFDGPSTKKVLDNGLTVLISEMPSSPMVSVYALVKAGSATEGEFLGSGVSHFLEHMLFKGTTRRGVGEIAAEIQALGGRINAATSFDYTLYTLTVPYDAFETALDIVADMLQHSVFDPQEVAREQEVIFGEMRLHEDNPARRLSQLIFSQVYKRHPYQHPIIGYKSLFGALSRDEIFAYYQKYYAPNNIILSIAGRVQSAAILPKIEAAFQGFERRNDIPRHLPSEPPQLSRRHYEEAYPTELARLAMAFSGVGLLDPDLYALDVLADILGRGQSARLYQKIYKQEGLVHSIRAMNYTPMDRGAFEIEAVLDYAQVSSVMAAVLKEVKRVQDQGVRKAELAKARKRVLSDYLFGQQKSSGVAHGQAIDEAFSGDYQFSKDYVQKINAVSREDIQRVARKYLKESALTSVVLKPSAADAAGQVARQADSPAQTSKQVLPNGLTLLTRADKTAPLVSIRLVLRGGTHEETPAKSGLAQMMAATWTRGTSSLSARQIAERTDALGMRVGGYAGKNSFGLSMQFLSEDIDTALALLVDWIKRPAFAPVELEKVRSEMLASIAQRQDNIARVSNLAMRGLLFDHHPLRLAQEGSIDSVNGLTRAQVLDHFTRYVVPSNMVLSIYGDIDPRQVQDYVQKHLSALKDRPVAFEDLSEERPATPREQTLHLDKQQAMVVFGFQGAAMGHPDRDGLKVMAAILGSSFNGRLFISVRDQFGQAYTLGGAAVPAIDTGMIYFYVLTSAESVGEVRRLVAQELARLRQETVGDEELTDIKNYLKGNFKAGHETIDAMNFTNSLDELYGFGFKYYETFDARVEAVTPEAIQALAQRYLDPDHGVVVVTLPVPASEELAIPSAR